MRQCMSEVWLGATGISRTKRAERHAEIGRVPIFAPRLHWKYQKACAWRGFWRGHPFSVPDNSLPTVRRLILQQWVIKESTGREGLRWQSSLLPERHRVEQVILMRMLFEETFIEQLWVTGPSFVLQAEEQVPEVDSGDALSHELPGACSAWAPGLGGVGPQTLEKTHERRLVFYWPFLCKCEIIENKRNPSMRNGSDFFTSALAPLTGESVFRFFLGPIAASAVRLASLCLIWASSCCCIWSTSSTTQISLKDKFIIVTAT